MRTAHHGSTGRTISSPLISRWCIRGEATATELPSCSMERRGYSDDSPSGRYGYWLADVQIHALRGQKAEALAALREAERAGWRIMWRYYRDFDPNLASIRNEPEFKAVFADIERDMAQQRARLAARPKDAPLDLTASGAP